MACNFLVALGNYAFQALIGRKLSLPEYGYANAATSAVLLLSLPAMAASNALIHYVARFVASEQKAELHGLIAAARKWLGLIVASSFFLALVLIRPLTAYCGFPRTTLIAVIGINMAAMLGTVFVTALCTGMGWYARLGCIAAGAILVKLALAWGATASWPTAEAAVLAAAASSFVYAAVLVWKNDFSGPGERIDPWNSNFAFFAVAALVSALSSYAFTQSDVLMAQRNFRPEALAYFCAAGIFSRALIGLTAPLLTVFFATQSAAKNQSGAIQPHTALLGSYLVALVAGGLAITIFRGALVHALFGRAEPAATALTARFALLMIIIGLIEMIANWALAARIWNVVWMHGALALCYVCCGIRLGKNPEDLLRVLTVTAGISTAILLAYLQLRVLRSQRNARLKANAASELVQARCRRKGRAGWCYLT